MWPSDTQPGGGELGLVPAFLSSGPSALCCGLSVLLSRQKNPDRRMEAALVQGTVAGAGVWERGSCSQGSQWSLRLMWGMADGKEMAQEKGQGVWGLPDVESHVRTVIPGCGVWCRGALCRLPGSRPGQPWVKYLGYLLSQVGDCSHSRPAVPGEAGGPDFPVHLLKPPPAGCVLLKKPLNFSEPPSLPSL